MRTSRGLKWKNVQALMQRNLSLYVQAQRSVVKVFYNFIEAWSCNTITSAVRKRQQTLKWLLDFDWLLRSYDYLILIFYWFISAG